MRFKLGKLHVRYAGPKTGNLLKWYIHYRRIIIAIKKKEIDE